MGRYKPSLKERLQYNFENTLSKGAVAIMAWLGVLSLSIVVITGGILAITGWHQPESESMNFIEASWESFMHAIDTGAISDAQGWKFRAIMMFVTIGGIFIISSLIGTITSGLESKLADLRKGRSRVLEHEHTLILGWSSKVFSIISELVIANQNRKNAKIVILADKDKVEMEDEIRSKFPSTKNTKIICRTGSPLDLSDLEVVNPQDARSIIILSPEDGNNPDTHVIKSVLAIINSPNRKEEKYHIVAEIRDEANMEAAALVAGDEAVLVLSGDLIARVTAQTCRQSGLSVVYTELLDFDGAEIYFKNEPGLVGKTYKDTCFAFEDSTVMGIYHGDKSVSINPPMDTLLKKGDEVIAISEDDDTLHLSNLTEFSIEGNAIVSSTQTEIIKESTLILGWNDKGITIIKELDNYVAANSDVLIIAETHKAKEDVEALQAHLQKQKLKFIEGNIASGDLLKSINIASFHHIIILCYQGIDIQEADAKTLIALLHLRNLAEQNGRAFSIVSEMLDVRNRELAEVTKADDFIVSDKLISLMLSQLSENKFLKKVFDALFSADGSEIYLKPVSDYVKPLQPVNFYTVLESAARKGETAIGHRINAFATNPAKGYGVSVNVKKSEKVTYTEADRIIVLAEN